VPEEPSRVFPDTYASPPPSKPRASPLPIQPMPTDMPAPKPLSVTRSESGPATAVGSLAMASATLWKVEMLSVVGLTYSHGLTESTVNSTFLLAKAAGFP